MTAVVIPLVKEAKSSAYVDLVFEDDLLDTECPGDRLGDCPGVPELLELPGVLGTPSLGEFPGVLGGVSSLSLSSKRFPIDRGLDSPT
jgi:hypothetical protein